MLEAILGFFKELFVFTGLVGRSAAGNLFITAAVTENV